MKLQITFGNVIGIKHSVIAVVLPFGTVVRMDATINNEMAYVNIFGV
ncbi:hypothetical protein N9C56_15245 [Paracoccaceae bacterium]|nr:hypothetical protein [Paracoccaceae bacterium]